MAVHEGGPPMGMMEDVGDAQAEADRWNSKGNAYLAVRDYITAISCFDLALKTYPASDQEDIFLSNRATADFRIGNYEAAVEGFRCASQLRPLKHSHLTCLGKVYLRWGGHETEALAALAESLRIERTSVAATLAAKAHAALERTGQGPGSGGSSAYVSPARSGRGLASPLQSPDDSPLSSSTFPGLLGRDSVDGGVAMASRVGSGRGPDEPRLFCKDSLREIIGTQTHFHDIEEDEEEEEEEEDEKEGEEETAGEQGKRHADRAGIVATVVNGKGSGRRHRRGSSSPNAAAAVVGSSPGGGGARAATNGSGSPVKTAAAAGALPPRSPTVFVAAAGTTTGVGARRVAKARAKTRPPAASFAMCLPIAADDVQTSPRQQQQQQRTVGDTLVTAAASVAAAAAAAAAAMREEVIPKSKQTDVEPRSQESRRYPEPASSAGNSTDNGNKQRKQERVSAFVSSSRVAKATGPETRRPASAVGGPAEGSASESGSEPGALAPKVGPKAGGTKSGFRLPPGAKPGTMKGAPINGRRLMTASEAMGTVKRSPAGSAKPLRASSSTAMTKNLGPTVSNSRRALLSQVRPADAVQDPAAERTVPEAMPILERISTRSRSTASGGEATTSRADRSTSPRPEGDSPRPLLPHTSGFTSDSSKHSSDEAGANDDGEDEDDEADIFPTALAAVANAVNRLSSPDAVKLKAPVVPAVSARRAAEPRLRHSKSASAELANLVGRSDVARAAIAAGAAPVKWGKEGAAERATSRTPPEVRGTKGGRGEAAGLFSADRTASMSSDEAFPPDLGPLGQNGRPVAAAVAKVPRRAPVAGDGNSGSGAGGGKDEKGFFFCGRLDTGGNAMIGGGRAAAARDSANSSSSVSMPRSYEDRRTMNDRQREDTGEAAQGDGGGCARKEGDRSAAGGAGSSKCQRQQLKNVRRHTDSLSSCSTASAAEGRGGGGGRAFVDIIRREESFDEPEDRARARGVHARRFSDGAPRHERGRRRSVGPGMAPNISHQWSEVGRIVRTSSLDPAAGRPRREVYLDNDAGEWSETAPIGRWRIRWPGRTRHVSIATCLESPAVARAGSMGSRGRLSPASSMPTDCATSAGGAAHLSEQDSRIFFSNSSTNSSPAALTHNVGAPRRGVLSRMSSSQSDNARYKDRYSSDRASGGSGGRRFRRWVAGRMSGGGAVPTEDLVRRWVLVVLGPRAMLLAEGEVPLGEGLKDGRVLVRLVRAVGGARAAGMAKEMAAATPMLQLVNVHAFTAAARAVGVPETSLFHPKDLVDAPSHGRCSPAVLACVAALSEAVRKNALTDAPGDFYNGPLLGDQEDALVVDARPSSKVSLMASEGNGDNRCPEGRRSLGYFGEETPTSPDSSFSGVGSGGQGA